MLRCVAVLLAAGLMASVPAFAQTEAPTPAMPPASVGISFEDLQAKADAGDPLSTYRLAEVYAHGVGVEPDAAKALALYQKAADLGESDAQLTMAVKYARGDGVTQDEPTAEAWLEKSANQSNAEAEYGMGMLKLMGQPADPASALTWFEKAVAHGNIKGTGMLGRMYRLGEGVPQDYVKAASYIQQASDHGDFASQFALGELYEKGNGVAADKVTALKWYILAARVDPDDCQPAVDALEKQMSPEDIAAATAQADAFKPVEAP